MILCFTLRNGVLAVLAVILLLSPFVANASTQYGSAFPLYQGGAAPVGVAVSSAGTVYWANYNQGKLYSMLKGASSPTVLLSGLNTPSGVAVDSSGNVYYSEALSDRVSELVGGSTTPQLLFSAANNINFISVDQSGNIYFVLGGGCNGQGFTNSIMEYVRSSGQSVTILAPVGSVGNNPSYGQVFVNSAGLYFTTCTGNVELLPAGSSTPQILVTGLQAGPSVSPDGVVADSQGNVFYTDYWKAVDELPAGSTSSVTIATAGGTHYGIAIDGQDNVYYSDNLGGTIWEIPATSSSVNNDKVTVSVSPTSLSGSGTFTVSGSVVAASGSVSNTAVVITVKNPSGAVVSTGQATVGGTGSSGTYTTTFVAGGTSSWPGGTYTVTATYGTILGGTPASASSSFLYLTNMISTSILTVSTSPSQTIVDGYTGVQINYTNTYSQSLSAFVWVVVHNAAGQTVGIFVGSAIMNSGAALAVFVPTFNLPAGSYAATVFATTTSSVAISQTSTVSLSL